MPVRECEEELFISVFSEQEGTFLGTGRAEIETFTGKRTEILEAAFGIAALDTGDTLGVVAAAFEFVHHMGDTSQDIRPPRDIGAGVCGRDRGGS